MDECTVQELARLAGVTVRTLHHYDRIGLLKPRTRSGSGYRSHTKDELLRLPQVLFCRELDVPLPVIWRAIDAPANPVQALRTH
jgi:DNA-binding transcriptional MerR regulator